MIVRPAVCGEVGGCWKGEGACESEFMQGRGNMYAYPPLADGELVHAHLPRSPLFALPARLTSTISTSSTLTSTILTCNIWTRNTNMNTSVHSHTRLLNLAYRHTTPSHTQKE